MTINYEELKKEDRFRIPLEKALGGSKEYDNFLLNIKTSKAREMLFVTACYVDIANKIHEGVRQSASSSIPLVFLIGLAERIAKLKIGKADFAALVKSRRQRPDESFFALIHFFHHISSRDKALLGRGVRRALLRHPHHSFAFKSVVRLLYNVRNRAVHGEDYWSFQLPSLVENGRLVGELTSSWLGKRKRPRREDVEVNLRYEDLRDIFIRIATSNILAVSKK